MNAFPDDYVLHNLPLIVLSGLGDEQDEKKTGGRVRNLLSEGGFRIRVDLPPVKGSTAQALLQVLLSHDSTKTPWHGRGLGPAEQNPVFRIQNAGRTYTLPPRKAPPPPQSPMLRSPSDGMSPPPQLTLHSPISPLTPSSPLYPDGIITPLWIAKHQSRLPSIFMSFFSLVSDSNTSTLQDNKTKAEINNIRSVLTTTNYKSRLVVVLLADGDIELSEVEDRINNIRRGTSLDVKSVFYLAADASQVEISEFSTGLLSSLYAGSLEYYRDLSKHTRRKRNRKIVPQPTVQPTSGASRNLPLAGWNVRYEFKLAVFAEFRQEMEAALRNYEVAYENLFGAEVLGTIPSWSPRFNEARMIADITAIRIVRCLLWLGQTTNAVKWWANHRTNVQNLVERRGAGTETYGWEAWQSIWSRTMAELVQRAQVLSPAVKNTSEIPFAPIFIDAEKTLPAGQRYLPWESLHHEGYWLNLAQKHVQNRRAHALKMPEEDRASPGQSPASVIASKAHLYDKYLVPEPYKENPLNGNQGYDHSSEIVDVLDSAVQHFSIRGQVHMAEVLQLKKAIELMKSQSWDNALSTLCTVWESQYWRQAGWWVLIQQVGQALLVCASELGKTELSAQLKWQLRHPVVPDHKQGLADTGSNDFQSTTPRLQVAVDTEHSLTRLVPGFVFATEEGHVGESMDVQISVQHTGSAPVLNLRLLQVKIVFEGGLKPVYLIDDQDEIVDGNTSSTTLLDIELEDVTAGATKVRRSSIGAAAAVGADVNLSLRPGQTKVFQTQVVPREAGDASVNSITMIFENNSVEMTLTASDGVDAPAYWWEFRRGVPVPRPCGRQRDATSAKVLPKPPKVDISVPNMRKTFYTNEQIEFTVQSENREDQAISGSIEVRLLSPEKNNVVLRWADDEDSAPIPKSDAAAFIQQLSSRNIDNLSVGGNVTHVLSLSNADEAIDHELEIIIDYTLQSNPEAKLTKLFAVDLPVIRPFEANFSFHSRYHEEVWPNFFSTQSVLQDTQEAGGIKQQYLITAVVCSFAVENLIIDSACLTTLKVVGGAACSITPGVLKQPAGSQQTKDGSPVLIRPEETKRFGFDMTLQKHVLGNRQPVAVDVSLEVRWRREGDECLNASVLQVPRFLAPSTEPRVLLRLATGQEALGLYRLDYTIENPSLHFLTFNLNMESSDDFAFSGTKAKNLSLVPISRHNVAYRILPNKRDAWIKVQLEVVDSYFGQTLRIQPASDGIRVDKQGNVLVYID